MDDATWKIALIEDDEDDFLITREMLEQARPGHIQIVWFTASGEALDYIRHNSVDVILVDLALGNESGFEFIQKAKQSGCKAPIIAITGFGDPVIDQEAMKTGVVDFLVKSEVTVATLERSVRYAIHREKAQ